MDRATRNQERNSVESERMSMAAGERNGASTGCRTPARVLVVGRSRSRRDRLAKAMRATPWAVEQASGVRAAREWMASGDRDLLIVEAKRSDDPLLALVGEAASGDDAPAVVVVSNEPSVELAIGAMRSGADDVLDDAIRGESFLDRLDTALAKSGKRREREAERMRLRRMCKKLNAVRREMFDQVGTLCDDLVNAYGELSEQIDVLDVMHEFQSLVRRELDVEALLRTTLEYLLAKGGPMNAAVFLPDTFGDFTLGAYVNYDCPRDSGEAMLDHLADVVPEEFGDDRQITLMRSDAEIQARLGDDGEWLSGNSVLVMSCFADGECLAVVTLFRDRRGSFEDGFLRTLEVIRGSFADQLARVIRVHHRCDVDKGGDYGIGHDSDDSAGEDYEDRGFEDLDDFGMAA